MFRKATALGTAICLMCSSLVIPSRGWAAEEEQAAEEEVVEQAAEEEQAPEVVRTIVGRGSEGWDIVDIRKVEGTVVVVSPAVGWEIDLEESNRFAIFQGRNVFNQQIDLPLLRVGVPGFQSAVFMKKGNDSLAVRVRYRSGRWIENRTLALKSEDELRRIREYIEHFSEIQKEEYTIADSSRIGADAEYPKYTDEKVSFEERSVRFPLRIRARGQVVLKDGDRIRGELVPLYEEGSILMETDLDTRRISVAEIDRVRFLGDKGSAAMEQAILSGIGGFATGALTGAFAAWQVGADVKATAIYAGIFFGTAGFVMGLLRGAGSTRGSIEYVLGPVKDKKGKKEK